MQKHRVLYRSPLPRAYSLSGYRLEGVLGQGAFGITYRGYDVNLNRTVAIKEYLPRYIAARDEGQTVRPATDDASQEFKAGLARFIAEASTLGQFEHPNIVQVHNVFRKNDTAYMVMRYEEGDTLSNILKIKGTLSEPEVLRIIFPLLSGLEAVHHAGFIHRDIKPSNIFLRSDGSPILLDFGSARAAVETPPRELTNLVTDGYAPIEQYTGRGDHQGPWTDIYALGATLYRAVTGQAPTDAVERGVSLANDATDTLERGADRAAGRYQEAFLKAIDYALQFRIDDRPQSVEQFRQRLESVPSYENIARVGGSLFIPAPRVVSSPRSMRQCEWQDVEPTENPGFEGVTRLHPRWGRRARSRITPIREWSGRALVGNVAAGLMLAVLVGGWPNHRATSAFTPPQLNTAQLPDSLSDPLFNNTDEVHLLLADSLLNHLSDQMPLAMKLEELLESAEKDVAALRLTTPEHNNAFDKYSRALVLDPNSGAAQAGIAAIADRYVELSYSKIDSGEIELAERYISKAQEISASAAGVSAVRNTIAKLRRGDEAGNDMKAMEVFAEPLVAVAGKSIAQRMKQYVIDDGVALRDDRRSNHFLRQIGGRQSR